MTRHSPLQYTIPIALATLVGCSGIPTQNQSTNTTDKPHTQKHTRPAGLSGDRITGTLSMRGSEPHTYLSLHTAKTTYQIINPKAFALDRMQGKTVTLSIKIVSKKIGPGFPAKIKVLSVVKAP